MIFHILFKEDDHYPVLVVYIQIHLNTYLSWNIDLNLYSSYNFDNTIFLLLYNSILSQDITFINSGRTMEDNAPLLYDYIYCLMDLYFATDAPRGSIGHFVFFFSHNNNIKLKIHFFRLCLKSKDKLTLDKTQSSKRKFCRHTKLVF